ncbi:MAG: DUF4340 domain-containing protein [Clostridia bacterium]|nr:DUF4340 domain-containing protein [Clostridia bacterium]
MKKSVKLIILTVLLLGAVAALAAVNRLAKKDEESPDEITLAVTAVSAGGEQGEGIKKIRWEKDGVTHEIERAGSVDFTYSADPDLPLDGELCTKLVDTLKTVTSTRIIAENVSDLSQYDLDKPTLKVTVTLDDASEIDYLFGCMDVNSTAYYFMSTQKRGTVYLVDKSVAETFPSDPLDLVEFEEINDLSAFDSINIKTPDTEVTLTVKDGVMTADDGKSKVTVDVMKAKDIRTSSNRIAFARCVDYKGNYKEYGLDKPACTLTYSCTYQSEDTEGASEEDFVLNIGKLDGNNYYYVCIDGSKLIYTADSSIFESLLISDINTLKAAGSEQETTVQN